MEKMKLSFPLRRGVGKRRYLPSLISRDLLLTSDKLAHAKSILTHQATYTPEISSKSERIAGNNHWPFAIKCTNRRYSGYDKGSILSFELYYLTKKYCFD